MIFLYKTFKFKYFITILPDIYRRRYMNRKIVSAFVCLLFISMIPIAAGLSSDIVEERGSESANRRLYLVFGFFPETTNETICYWIIPPFLMAELLVDDLQSVYHGRFFIIGFSTCKPNYSPPSLN